MRVNEVVNQKFPKVTDIENNWEIIEQFIKNNCSYILNIYRFMGGIDNGGMIYRGFDHKIGFPISFTTIPKKNREPALTDKSVQRIVDKKLSKLGFTALRGNSFFCSGDRSCANAYGFPYMVFPLNGFTFTWSPLLRDFYIDYDSWIFTSRYTNLDKIPPGEFKKHYKFQNTDIIDSIKSKNEILINGKCLFLADTIFRNDVLKLLDNK